MRLLLLLLSLLAISAQAQSNLDSTREGFKRSELGLWFKKHDPGTPLIKIAARLHKANSDELILPKPTYQLVWNDEFESFNDQSWQRGQPWGRYHGQLPHQFYGDDEVLDSGGYLLLQNRYHPTDFIQERWVPDSSASILIGSEPPLKREADTLNIPWGTGLVNTFHSQSWTYGFFAVRCKNPAGPATWPAFWLTGRYNWPPEIDIFEMYGLKNGKHIHCQTMTLHFGKIETQTKRLIMRHFQLPKNTTDSFHIYACEWTPEVIRFYTDGRQVARVKLNRYMRQYFQEPMYLIVNNAVDHRYLDYLEPSQAPTSLVVDWIRVFQEP